MAHPHDFAIDAMKREMRCITNWYDKNLMKVLYRAKENHAREADATIEIGKKLVEALNEKLPHPEPVPLREVEKLKDDSLMKPIDPKLVRMFYKDSEKGGADRYLHERYKIRPEDRFFFRIVTSWDYGWHQREARVPPRDVNYGKCALLQQAMYRRSNAGPDPPHYAQPSGGEVSICSEYSCNPN